MNVDNIHISEIEIENYKSLRNSKISFKSGLNIIIGQNGAGKSNLLGFIYQFATRNYLSMRRMHARNLNTSFGVIIEYFEKSQKHILKFVVDKIKKSDPKIDTSNLYEVTLSKQVGKENIVSNEKFLIGNPDSTEYLSTREKYKTEIEAVGAIQKTYIKFQFPEESLWISKPTKLVIDADNDLTFEDSDYEFNMIWDLETDFEFYFTVKLNKKKISDSVYLKKKVMEFIERYIETKNINSILNQYSPIQTIRINPNINIYSNEQITIVENLSFDFLINDSWMPWSYLSDGTKRLFYLLTEIISSNNNLILIEEPELGIHPHQLFKVLQFIKEQSSEKQIIISTHSPIVLDILNQDELDRITIAKFDKGTKFIKLTKPQITKAKQYMTSVGDLSYYWLHSDLEK